MWAAGQCSRKTRSTGVVSKMSPSELKRITKIRVTPGTCVTWLYWCIGQDPFINFQGTADHLLHRERVLHPLAPGPPKGLNVFRVTEEIAHRVCQRLGGARWYQEASDAVLHCLRNTTSPCGHNGFAQRHSVQDGCPQTLKI